MMIDQIPAHVARRNARRVNGRQLRAANTSIEARPRGRDRESWLFALGLAAGVLMSGVSHCLGAW